MHHKILCILLGIGLASLFLITYSLDITTYLQKHDAIISYKEQLPDRIPIPHETEVSAPWDDAIELIYTSAPGPSGYIWLFGHGIRGNKDKMVCIFNNRKTRLVYAETASLYNYIRAFLCLLPHNLKYRDKISIFYEDRVIKSIAWFDPKYFEEKKTLRYFLCLVTQIKNMAYMVEEWFQYHRRVGFDHILLYDNNSTDNLRSLFENYSDMEIIPWPWRRSQQQAYTHALLFTKSRCVWALFMDLDFFMFPRLSGSIREILQNVSKMNVAQVGFKALRMSHDNLIKCPNTSIVETYIHRKKLPDAWDQHPFSAVLTSLGLPIHQIHRTPLSPPFESMNLNPEIAYGLHYSDRCYEQYYYQKLFGRNGVRDWNTPKNHSITNPLSSWRILSEQANVKDTELRDFKRSIDKLDMPAPLLI